MNKSNLVVLTDYVILYKRLGISDLLAQKGHVVTGTYDQ